MLWRETQNDTILRLKAFEGLKKYQAAPRAPHELRAKVFATAGPARLLHYGGTGRPVIFIPSLINPHVVLDLSERNSLLRYLSTRGLNVFLIDWGTPAAEDRDLGLAGHIEQRLLPLLRGLKERPVLAGYCLGGTIAAAAAGLIDAAGLAMIAAPWAFDALSADYLALIDKVWSQAKPVCERLGYVPMEVLQSGFWALDPQRTIRKYAAFADMPEGSEAAANFIILEDWANEGAPLTLGAGKDLFEKLYGANDSGAGQWRVGGRIADPAGLKMPFLNVLSETDRIVPAATAHPGGKTLRLSSGHVGMIVGSSARQQLWEPLAEWLLESAVR